MQSGAGRLVQEKLLVQSCKRSELELRGESATSIPACLHDPLLALVKERQSCLPVVGCPYPQYRFLDVSAVRFFRYVISVSLRFANRFC